MEKIDLRKVELKINLMEYVAKRYAVGVAMTMENIGSHKNISDEYGVINDQGNLEIRIDAGDRTYSIYEIEDYIIKDI
jgi:hypothetical protein